MTPRTADRIMWALLAATLILAAIVAATGCHAPRPGYGVPRHLTAVGR